MLTRLSEVYLCYFRERYNYYLKLTQTKTLIPVAVLTNATSCKAFEIDVESDQEIMVIVRELLETFSSVISGK